MFRTLGTDQRQVRPPTAFMLGIDQGVEEEGNKIGKMVGVKMGKQNMCDTMAVHATFDQIHQCTRAKVQQHGLVRLDEIACSRPGRVYIGAGPENRQTHSIAIIPNNGEARRENIIGNRCPADRPNRPHQVTERA